MALPLTNLSRSLALSMAPYQCRTLQRFEQGRGLILPQPVLVAHSLCWRVTAPSACTYRLGAVRFAMHNNRKVVLESYKRTPFRRPWVPRVLHSRDGHQFFSSIATLHNVPVCMRNLVWYRNEALPRPLDFCFVTLVTWNTSSSLQFGANLSLSDAFAFAWVADAFVQPCFVLRQ